MQVENTANNEENM